MDRTLDTLRNDLRNARESFAVAEQTFRAWERDTCHPWFATWAEHEAYVCAQPPSLARDAAWRRVQGAIRAWEHACPGAPLPR